MNHNHQQGLCEIKIKELSVKKGGRQLLSGISFALDCGQLTALIGPNGAGKTTLLRALLGDLPYRGRIDYVRYDGRPGRAQIGYVPQLLEFDRSAPVSVLDFLAAGYTGFPVFLGVPQKVRAQVEQALGQVGCPQAIDRRMGELSGGELQRVLLAMALNPLPDLLALDEPFSGIDQRGLKDFYALVAHLRDSYHMSIVLVSHDLQWVREQADQVVLLEGGRVAAAGAPEAVFGTPAFYQAFGEGE